MKLFERIMGYLQPQNAEQEDYIYEDEEEEEEFFDSYEQDFRDNRSSWDEPISYGRHERENKVVSIHQTVKLQVVIARPESFQEVAEIANHLIEKRTVVLNLERVGKDVARRIVDFMSGAAYANSGQLKRIAVNTYLVVPLSVGLIGADVLGELENNGVFL